VSNRGIIIGCDQRQEWLLPWWWKHYSMYNSFPVVFTDFGMSEKAISWCKERGECIVLPSAKILHENEISVSGKDSWENRYGKGIWLSRSAWFKKPLSLLLSPFLTGIWIDLDCQINGELDPLFNSLISGAEIGLVREPHFVQTYDRENGFLLPQETNYNSGVIVFRQNASILHQWVVEAITNNSEYPGDQQALSRAIYKHRPTLIELPFTFNWLRFLGPQPDALIYHHSGGGKLELLKQIHPSVIPLIESLKDEHIIGKKDKD
jgi:hypothetical protein